MAECAQSISNFADNVTVGSPIVTISQELSQVVVIVAQNAQAALQDVHNEGIRHNYRVKAALHDLKLVVELAYAFLDKVDDIFYYCQCNSMTVAIQGLSYPRPQLQPLRDLINHLGKLFVQAETAYSELVGACNAAARSCREAAEDCAHMERESRKKKRATRGVGGTVAGAALAGGTAAAVGGTVATGVAISALAGVFTFGIGTIVGLGITAAASTAVGAAGVAAGVGTAVATHCIASDYAKSEAAFRKIGGEFDALLQYAYDLNEGVAQVHTALENTETQVHNISYCINMTNASLIRDSVTRLNMVCGASYGNTSRSREYVRGKTEDLKAKFNSVY